MRTPPTLSRPFVPAAIAAAIALTPLLDAAPQATPAAVPPAAPEEAKPAPEPTTAEIERAIRDLDSEKFTTRETATRALWNYGHAAEPLLKAALQNGGSEMRYRGQKILDEFKLGLYPDTPEDLRKLVENFRKGDATTRTMAVQKLAARGQTDLLIKLAKRERDPSMRNVVAALIAKNVAEMAPKHIYDGDLQQAEDLLQLAALSSRGMRDYTTFLFTLGKLDTAIAAQRDHVGDSPVDAELLGWMLRVKGESAAAAKLFEDAGQTSLARDARASGGELLAYAQTFADPSRRTADSLAYTAAAARLSGDIGALGHALADLVDYAKAMPDEADRCMNALILNGAPDRAFELAADLQDGSLLEMNLWRYDFDATFNAMGVDPDDAPYDTWLAEFSKGFKIRKEQDIPAAILPAGRLASVCALTGQTAAAEHILRTVARLLETENASILPLLGWERLAGLDALAREHAVKAMELEIEATVISSLFPMRADYAWLTAACWDYLRAHYPDESTATALDRMHAMLNFDTTADIDPAVAATIAAMDTSTREAAPVVAKELLRMVADLARLHRLWDTAADATGRWLPMLGQEDAAYHHIRYAEVLAESGKPREAAAQYQKAWEFAPANPVPLYLQGVALGQAGDAAAAAGLKRKASLMAIGSVSARHFLATAMWQSGDDEAARQQDSLLLRIASPHESVHPEALRRRYSDLAISGTASQAATALDAFLLSKMRPVNAASVLTPRTTLAYYANLRTLQARATFDSGDPTGAAATIAALQKINPSDSSMLEDIYQLLRDAGLTAEADALFTTTYKVSKSTVDRFPGRGQHHNNHAWLLSRCARKLDEALAHAETAVGMEPANGAFLDTLAEVHFQRGERALAVAASEKAVALLGGDPQVLRQLERFKTGNPTDR